VSTPPMFHGQTFTVMFPATGNFKFACLFHENMTGAIHVLATSDLLPHDQAFYDNEAKTDRRALIARQDYTGHLTGHGSGNDVIAGVGRVVATTGGTHTVSILRFMQKRVTIHVGDSVAWGNDDPITPHTITFGVEPENPIPPSPNVTVDADGSRHATLTSTADSAHSGFIQAAPQDRIGLPQSPVGVMRFRVTFTKRGTYRYICALHDGLGMVGTVVVEP
jgi:plastocyanin